jgi:ABC-2 type transport system permease protein
LTETSKIAALALLTIVYLFFWLSLGILYSVLTKRMATSILVSIAMWLTFSIIITILASVVAGIIIPLPGGTFRSQTEGSGMQIRPEFREAMEERAAVTSTIQKISPTNLYEEAASDILGVVGGFVRGMGRQEFQRTLTLGEALAANWANIATIVVGLVVCFAASYMIFLRSEIRPGD